MQQEIRSLEQIEDRQRKRENNRADENSEVAPPSKAKKTSNVCILTCAPTTQGLTNTSTCPTTAAPETKSMRAFTQWPVMIRTRCPNNNIQKRPCNMFYEIQPSCSFGEGHRSGDRASETCGSTELLLVGLFYIAFRGRIRR
jgi:hypothetical protein